MVRRDTTRFAQSNEGGLPLEEVRFLFLLVTPKFSASDEQCAAIYMFQRKGNAATVDRRPIPETRPDTKVAPQTTGSAGGVDVDSLLREAKEELPRRIRINLAEDMEDAVASGEIGPTNDAVEACLRLAERVAPHVALAPRLKCAAFVEGNGVVALVLQSLVTDRRLTCRFAADGLTMVIYRIDEGMEADQEVMRTDAANAPRELGEWVTKRA